MNAPRGPKDSDERSVISLNSDRNKQIIVTAFNNEKIINTWVKFYNYTKSQRYEILKDKTYTKLMLNVRMPKWMVKKCEDIFNMVSQNPFSKSIIFYIYSEDYLYTINISNPWEYQYGISYSYNGLEFMSNYKMISFKNELNYYYKKFISTFKQINNSELESLVKAIPFNESYQILTNHAKGYESGMFTENDILIRINNVV